MLCLIGGVLLLDCLIVLFSGYVGNYLEIGGLEFAKNFWKITLGNIVSVVLFVVAFRFFHTYTGILRYSSLIDLERVGVASFLGSLLSLLVGFIVNHFETSVILINSLFGNAIMFGSASLLMWIERMIVRALFDAYKTDNAIPVAIYGTMAGGISIANSISSVKNKTYLLQAFISDGNEMRNSYLMGKRVFYKWKRHCYQDEGDESEGIACIAS